MAKSVQDDFNVLKDGVSRELGIARARLQTIAAEAVQTGVTFSVEAADMEAKEAASNVRTAIHSAYQTAKASALAVWRAYVTASINAPLRAPLYKTQNEFYESLMRELQEIDDVRRDEGYDALTKPALQAASLAKMQAVLQDNDMKDEILPSLIDGIETGLEAARTEIVARMQVELHKRGRS